MCNDLFFFLSLFFFLYACVWFAFGAFELHLTLLSFSIFPPLLRVNGFTNRWVHGYLAMLCKLRKSFLSLVLFDFYIYFWGYLSPSPLPTVSEKYPPPFPSHLFYIMLILPKQSTQKTNCAGQGNSFASCMAQYTTCAHQCRAAMPK